MNWILALVGLAVIFLSRYASRSTKTEPSISFWWRDNWVELIQGLLVTFLFMVILQLTSFNNESFSTWFMALVKRLLNFDLPSDVILPAKEVISALIGWVATGAVYWLNKRKSKWTIKKKSS